MSRKSLSHEQAHTVLRATIGICHAITALKHGSAYMQGPVIKLGAEACASVLEIVSMIWPHVNTGNPHEEEDKDRITDTVVSLLGQVSGEALERCKAVLSGRLVHDREMFKFNTYSRTRRRDSGYAQRYFIQSEQVPWTAAFPGYEKEGLCKDFTCDAQDIHQKWSAETEDPKDCRAFRKLLEHLQLQDREALRKHARPNQTASWSLRRSILTPSVHAQ